jgi:Ca2+-transporting ATPase
MKDQHNRSQQKDWALSSEKVLNEQEVSSDQGLSEQAVKRRRREFGPNRLRAAKRRSGVAIFVDQIKNPIVLLLAVAAVISFSFQRFLEGVSIVIAIVINGAIGFFTELKAVRSMEALHELSRVETKVIRDGDLQRIPSEDLVPGDMVFLEAGDIVSADLRLTEASRLQVDESALTGESMAVSKSVKPVEEDTTLAERTNMAFKGTSVTAGSGHGVVVATGMETELGKVASMTEEAEEELTPLEKRLNRLAYRLIWITLGVAVVVAVTGLLAQKQVLLIIETSIALAVAAIPEGLPIVATIALARGMWRMAQHNAVMNRLSAVETLGATNVIFTDKTGTLTENRMQVSRLVLPSEDPQDTEEVNAKGGDSEEGFSVEGSSLHPSEHPLLRLALQVGVLCNNADLDREEDRSSAVGDPMEVALLEAGHRAGMDREELLESMPEEKEVAFDPEIMMMATFHRKNRSYRVAIKGAPEAVLDASGYVQIGENRKEMGEEIRNTWKDANRRLAEEGFRVLALATKETDSMDVDPYEGIAFLGLVGLFDPPREDVKSAIQTCQEAGITVIMVTGDQAVTARHVGQTLRLIEPDDPQVIHGKDLQHPDDLSQEERQRLLDARIFARVNPKQKLDLIVLHQGNNAVVAMTGDGVNDAPALKKADIGVAMGQRGTQVAKEAADMVLQDDAFQTISVAIQQGRAIFDNIRKFILFLLSGNVGEIMIVAFALLAGAPLPILPLQILYLNMIGDVFPALALGVGRGDPSKMKRPPRDPKEAIMTRAHWLAVGGYGLLIALPVLGSFGLALTWMGMETRAAVTVSFLTLAFARLWHVFNMRDPGLNPVRNEVTRNPFVWGALGLCTGLLLAAAYVPGLSLVLEMVPPDTQGWFLILGASLIPLLVGQTLKMVPLRILNR